MFIDFGDMTPQQIYFTLTQTVIPRPIAWVLSENANASFNLAPFSYFNAISSNPPLVMISAGMKPEGGAKDTRDNIRDRHDFVIHIVSLDQLDAMNASSAKSTRALARRGNRDPTNSVVSSPRVTTSDSPGGKFADEAFMASK
jgi:flavin reductase (DIM6/NTAB) family NADH-FMN oxidoreductase RutF